MRRVSSIIPCIFFCFFFWVFPSFHLFFFSGRSSPWSRWRHYPSSRERRAERNTYRFQWILFCLLSIHSSDDLLVRNFLITASKVQSWTTRSILSYSFIVLYVICYCIVVFIIVRPVDAALWVSIQSILHKKTYSWFFC